MKQGMAIPAKPRLFIPALGQVYAALDEWTLALLRFLAGLSMFMHGLIHISSDMAQTASFFEGEGYLPGLFWAWAVTLTEFAGGLCLAVGFLTRLVAVPIFLFLITAVFYHMKNGFYWDQGGFEYPLMWAAVVLVFLVRGGGKASVDGLIGTTL
jgi:putative oxidoreductase